MTIWKKALSGAMSATLLASLLGTAFASSALAATDSSAYLGACGPVSCSVVADGISRVRVHGQTLSAAPAAGSYVQLSIAGASFSTAAADAVGFTVINSSTARGAVATGTLDGDFVTITSATAAGTATITVYVVPAFGTATTEGTFTVDFYAADQLAVSLANSTNGLAPNASEAATPAGPTGDSLTTTVRNSVGTGGTLVPGAKVTYTISPVGTLSCDIAYCPAGTVTGAQQITATTNAGGVAVVTINSTGIPGTATITTSVVFNSVTTVLAAKTYTFYGALSKLTLSNLAISQAINSGPSTALKVVATDVAGNKIDGITVVGVVPSGSVVTALAPLTATGAGAAAPPPSNSNYISGTGAARVLATCGATAGKTSLQVKVVIGSTTTTSNAVDFYCADAVAKTFTIKADATAVAPGGNTGITVNILEKNGLPVPDGYEAVVLTNSGAVFGDVVGNSATTFGGDAVWTFLAPSTAGIATLTGFVGNLDTIAASTALLATQSVSVTIGAVVPASTFNVTGTALGNTLTGPFTPASKISTGGYITWRFDGGAAVAGKTIEIWAYKKVGLFTNPWSAPYLLTTRVANASGVAFANITSGSVIWLSIRPVLAATATDAAVWGPWSIGRWIH